MHGLPDDFDAGFFIDSTLESIAFAEYSIYLHFDRQILITLESSFELRSDSDSITEQGKPPVDTSALMALVGKRVRAATSTRDGTLTLKFSDGFELRLFDDSADYESYSITVGENTTYV